MQPHIAVVLTDAERKIQWVNHDFTIMTGYHLAEVIGKKPSILQGAGTDINDIKRISESLKLLLPFKDSLLNYTKEGKPYRCNFVIHPIFDSDGILKNFIAFEVDASRVDDSSLPLLQLREKYATSSLKNVESTNIYIKLVSMMQEEQLYLDPELSLRELANRLHTNTRYLSQVVNTLSGFNLQYFINSYRIEEIKRIVMSQEMNDRTLYGIAQQCGFKNKSTFYKVFREIIGLTPKDYIRQQNINVAKRLN
jgi:PAS domain S-box-containing protein